MLSCSNAPSFLWFGVAWCGVVWRGRVVCLQVSQLAGRCHFFGRGDEADFQALQALLESGERVSGLICEFPSNPLLTSPDIDRLRQLADNHDFVLACDDTVAGFCNVNLLTPGGVDLTMTSLTKQFAGSGNVMGGTVVLNQHSPR